MPMPADAPEPRASLPAPALPAPAFATTVAGSNALLLIGSSLMLLAGTAAVVFATSRYSGDSALWFIGFILIALSGLSMTAAVFRALGFPQSAGEAFGLPTGSIRAVLAIAVMVLLPIFGLPLVTVAKDAPTLVDTSKPFATVRIDCAAADAEAKRYGGFSIMATVNKERCAASASAPAAPGAPAPPPPSAVIALYANTPQGLPEAQRDQAKTLLTAIVTLLTTIIGFYFGSQNALTLVKLMQGKKPERTPKPPETGSGTTTSGGTDKSGADDADSADDPDDADDGCPSGAAPQPGDAQTADDSLPAAEGGVEPAPADAATR